MWTSTLPKKTLRESPDKQKKQNNVFWNLFAFPRIYFLAFSRMAAPAHRETTRGCGRYLSPFGFHNHGQHCVRLEPAQLNQPHSSPATRTRKIVCRAGARVNGRSDFGKKVSCHSLGHKFPPRALFPLLILIF
jgi:hypothetical protein